MRWARTLVLSLALAVLFWMCGSDLAVAFERNLRAIQELAWVPAADMRDLLGGSCQCPRVDRTLFARAAGDNVEGALYRQGRALFYQQQYGRAVAALEAVTAGDGPTILADYFLGASHLCSHDGSEAALYWREETMAWTAFRGVADCIRAGDNRRATTLYDYALSAQPQIWDGWNSSPPPTVSHYHSAAALARELGDEEAELHWLLLAAATFPDSPVVDYQLGVFYEAAGDLLSARKHYMRAVLNSPGERQGESQYHFIRVSLQLRDWTASAAAIEQLLAPSSPNLDRDWRKVAWLIHLHGSPELCQLIGRTMEASAPAVSEEVARLQASIRETCLVSPESD